MRWMMSAAALAVSVAAGPASAQDGRYTLDEKTMIVPAPKGLCAEGKAVDGYMSAQRGSGQVVPDVVMMRCGATDVTFDFYAVRALRDQRMTRPALLAELRRSMPQAQATESLVPEKARQALAAQLTKTLAADVTVNAGIKPVGVDDVCGYIAGVVSMQVAGRTAQATIIGCATVIEGRVTYLFRYLPGGDRDAAVAALPELRSLALATAPGK